MGIRLARPASVAVFLALAVLIAFDSAGDIRHLALLLAAVLTAGYLALNIGANDAANNIGTAVGSGALTLSAALLLAAAGELAGAFLAGDPVSARLREGLFQTDTLGHGKVLARVLIAGMLAGALWLHSATLLRAPVSATHSVVGGLLGAAVSANGWSSVQWDEVSSIALAWLFTPLAAALIAAVLFSGSGTAAAANGELAEDILHGSGAVTASPSTPYIQVDSGPKGTETDLLSNLHEVEQSSKFVPYVQTGGDMDNRDNLIDQV